MKCLNKIDGANHSNSNSSFASSSDSNPFYEEVEREKSTKDPSEPSFTPIYRHENGGILIYDVDAIIPGQKLPSFDSEYKYSLLKVIHQTLQFPLTN